MKGARAGAAWLLAHAAEKDGTLAWCHYLPDHEDRFMEGWCHGPTGTLRLFLVLAAIEDDPRWEAAAIRAAAWIRAERPSPGPSGSKTRFYSPSLCCGAAGVIDAFVELHRATGEKGALAYAREVASYLIRLSKPDGKGRKWTNYDREDEEGLIYHGTSLMLGASGEALALLRLAAARQKDDPLVMPPDRRVDPGEARAIVEREPVITEEAPRTEETVVPGTLTTTVITPARGHDGDAYVVLCSSDKKSDPRRIAAERLARWRHGEVIDDFDPLDPAPTMSRLAELGARRVAVVLDPDELDTDTHRRLLVAACGLDDDIFPDFSFGFITGTADTKVTEIIERTKRLQQRGMPRRWDSASVASSIKSMVLEGCGDPTAVLAGFEGQKIYWGALEFGPDVMAFVDEHIGSIGKGGGIVELSGCGDPEGIWLFSDRRNMQRDKHWEFSPDKVGFDPEGEMPRITAEIVRRMPLTGCIVISGVCHTGSLSRTFVEGDIVSTFGRVEKPTEYRIPGRRSIAAAILDAGAVAYIAPLGPNHGYRNLVEAQEALEEQLDLGDMVRSTYCDVAIAQGSAISLDLYADSGEVDRGTTGAMVGGAANRALLGDPALAPFAKIEPPPAAIAVTRQGDAEGVSVIHATVRHRDWWNWDMLSHDEMRERIRIVIELEPADPAILEVTASASDKAGESVNIGRLDAHIERIDGKRLLHLQVAALRGAGLGDVGASATFRLTGVTR